jgi:Tfp pilus assembly protein PilO
MLKQLLKFKEAIFYLIIIFGVFIWLLTQIIPDISELIKTEQKIKKLNVEFDKVTKKLEKIKAEVAENKKEEADRVKQIYKPEISFDSGDTEYLLMVDDIVDIIKDNGVKLYSIDYNYDVNTDEIVSQSAGKYNGCMLTLALIGNYSQLKNLIMDFIKYPYLVTINSIDMEPYDNNNAYLLSVIRLTIYSEQ